MEQETETSKKESFYGELDRRSGRSCFSFTTLVIFLMILLLLGSGGAIWLIKKARELPTAKNRVFPSQQAKEAIAKKIEELIKHSADKSKVTFELSEEELTTLLVENLGRSALGKRFKEPQVELDPPLIVIRATLVDPLRSQTTWYIEPKTIDGELKARIVRIEAGKLILPETITGQFSTNINELVAGFLPLTGRFKASSVEVRTDMLVIKGTID
ncbi:MAG: hypothetical protein WAP74_01940 [Patescibacteria group bacterium]